MTRQWMVWQRIKIFTSLSEYFTILLSTAFIYFCYDKNVSHQELLIFVNILYNKIYICAYLYIEFWQARKNGVEVSIITKNFHYSTNIKELSLEIFTHLKEFHGFAQQCLSSWSQIFILPYMLSFKTRHLKVLWTVPFMSIYSCCYRSLTTVQSCFDLPTKAASGLHHCALYCVLQRSAVDLRATRSPA